MSKEMRSKPDNSWKWMLAITGIITIAVIILSVHAGLNPSGAGEIINSLSGNVSAEAAELLSKAEFAPPALCGFIINPQSETNYFDFVLDTGDDAVVDKEKLTPETKELINYFFLGITLPAREFWVNLNPVELNSIISPMLICTGLGKMLLETDLRLKRDAAMLTDPRLPCGKEYWDVLKAELNAKNLSDVQIPANTRLWIIPADAVIEEDKDNKDKVILVGAKLKVCLESEYDTDLSANGNISQSEEDKKIQDIASQAMKKVILPIIEFRVNYSKDYAQLRQIYQSLILAEYFKHKYWGKQSIYESYINTCSIGGLETKEGWSKEAMFDSYVQSMTKGEYSCIQQEYDPAQAAMIKRHYFSGGMLFSGLESGLAQGMTPIGPGVVSSGIGGTGDLIAQATTGAGAGGKVVVEDINLLTPEEAEAQRTAASPIDDDDDDDDLTVGIPIGGGFYIHPSGLSVLPVQLSPGGNKDKRDSSNRRHDISNSRDTKKDVLRLLAIAISTVVIATTALVDYTIDKNSRIEEQLSLLRIPQKEINELVEKLKQNPALLRQKDKIQLTDAQKAKVQELMKEMDAEREWLKNSAERFSTYSNDRDSSAALWDIKSTVARLVNLSLELEGVIPSNDSTVWLHEEIMRMRVKLVESLATLNGAEMDPAMQENGSSPLRTKVAAAALASIMSLYSGVPTIPVDAARIEETVNAQQMGKETVQLSEKQKQCLALIEEIKKEVATLNVEADRKIKEEALRRIENSEFWRGTIGIKENWSEADKIVYGRLQAQLEELSSILKAEKGQGVSKVFSSQEQYLKENIRISLENLEMLVSGRKISLTMQAEQIAENVDRLFLQRDKYFVREIQLQLGQFRAREFFLKTAESNRLRLAFEFIPYTYISYLSKIFAGKVSQLERSVATYPKAWFKSSQEEKIDEQLEGMVKLVKLYDQFAQSMKETAPLSDKYKLVKAILEDVNDWDPNSNERTKGMIEAAIAMVERLFLRDIAKMQPDLVKTTQWKELQKNLNEAAKITFSADKLSVAESLDLKEKLAIVSDCFDDLERRAEPETTVKQPGASSVVQAPNEVGGIDLRKIRYRVVFSEG